MDLTDVQKNRYSRGAIVYNTNNNRYAIVIDGRKGEDADPCSLVMELCNDNIFVHTPPNRALIPIGKFLDLEHLREVLNGNFN